MNKFCVILTTTEKKDIAEEIAYKLVNDDLSKCVQIDQVASFFKWEDKLLTENEFRVMIKAESDKYQLIETAILKLHNYKLPQIVKIDITGGLPNYLKWLGGE